MSIRALMVDVDGVLVCGRPSDGKPWASTIEADLGVRQADLHQAFFARHWNDIVIGRRNLVPDLKPVLEMIAPHLPCEDFIRYWFENDACVGRSFVHCELCVYQTFPKFACINVWNAA